MVVKLLCGSAQMCKETKTAEEKWVMCRDARWLYASSSFDSAVHISVLYQKRTISLSSWTSNNPAKCNAANAFWLKASLIHGLCAWVNPSRSQVGDVEKCGGSSPDLPLTRGYGRCHSAVKWRQIAQMPVQ